MISSYARIDNAIVWITRVFPFVVPIIRIGAAICSVNLDFHTVNLYAAYSISCIVLIVIQFDESFEQHIIRVHNMILCSA